MTITLDVILNRVIYSLVSRRRHIKSLLQPIKDLTMGGLCVCPLVDGLALHRVAYIVVCNDRSIDWKTACVNLFGEGHE